MTTDLERLQEIHRLWRTGQDLCEKVWADITGKTKPNAETLSDITAIKRQVVTWITPIAHLFNRGNWEPAEWLPWLGCQIGNGGHLWFLWQYTTEPNMLLSGRDALRLTEALHGGALSQDKIAFFRDKLNRDFLTFIAETEAKQKVLEQPECVSSLPVDLSQYSSPAPGFLSYRELADRYGIPRDKLNAFKMAIQRWRVRNPGGCGSGWIELNDGRRNGEQYLYSPESVMDIINRYLPEQRKGQ